MVEHLGLVDVPLVLPTLRVLRIKHLHCHLLPSPHPKPHPTEPPVANVFNPLDLVHNRLLFHLRVSMPTAGLQATDVVHDNHPLLSEHDVGTNDNGRQQGYE